MTSCSLASLPDTARVHVQLRVIRRELLRATVRLHGNTADAADGRLPRGGDELAQPNGRRQPEEGLRQSGQHAQQVHPGQQHIARLSEGGGGGGRHGSGGAECGGLNDSKNVVCYAVQGASNIPHYTDTPPVMTATGNGSTVSDVIALIDVHACVFSLSFNWSMVAVMIAYNLFTGLPMLLHVLGPGSSSSRFYSYVFPGQFRLG
jgi:hypothetical protein